jgi:hypothetical protein
MKQRTILTVVVLVAASVVLGSAMASGTEEGTRSVRGGATTMIEGGTGAPDFIPVLTKLAFYWNGTKGDLECLAIAPGDAPGQGGSGDFDTNVMYVTGPITSGSFDEGRAVLRGKATVTGLGAGENMPFTLIVRTGGPGTPVVLRVSGLVFNEIVLEGQIAF